MKGSGINYFYDLLNLDTGSFAVFYTFEDGAGSNISSVPSGQAIYSGTLNTVGSFWSKPGSGYFQGNQVTINNASGLQSTAWTDILIYEKVNTNPAVLVNSLDGGSGYKIGITESNKPYFESFNQQPIVAGSLNNYSSKNLIAVTYLPNYVTIGYYDFNSKQVETETFDFPFEVIPSDNRYLGGSFTGYLDTYIHLTSPLNSVVLNQLFSGFWAIPTGTETPITYDCVTGITGYQDVFVATTGITGYVISQGGDIGRDYYTGQFPAFHTTSYLTGYLSTGLFSSGITGVICYPITGTTQTSFEHLTGYASSFGMEKIEFLSYVASGDIIKQSLSYTPFDNRFNIATTRQYSGFLLPATYTTGQINEFLNGLAQAGRGWYLTGDYVIVTGAVDADIFFFDNQTGPKRVTVVASNVTGYSIPYTGQDLYLNGLNLVSGYDFIATGNGIGILPRATGVTGYLSEYPIELPEVTGNYSLWTGVPFSRRASLIYVNGLRQQITQDYIEGSLFDLLSGTTFNPANTATIYNNNNLYWEF